MKIVVLTSAHPAFDIRIYHKQAVTLARAGHDVALVAVHEADTVSEGVRVRAIPRAQSRRERMTTTVARMLRTALEENADVYHIHDPELLAAALVLRLAGRRVVYDVHENLAGSVMTKHWIPRPLRRSIALAARAGEYGASRLMSGVVAATPSIARQFRPSKTAVVQNFPLRSEIEFACVPYDERPMEVAYVGGISDVRGAREMVAAVGIVARDRQARLRLAGPIRPPQFQAELERSGDWSHVDYFPWLSRAELVGLLGRVRVGLLVLHDAPNYVNSQPTKLFEYMSAGVPVVASDFPLWRSLVEDVGCGLLVDPRDTRAIAEAIRWLLAHPAEARAMGERGRRAVHERFNWDIEARTLLDFYARLAG